MGPPPPLPCDPTDPEASPDDGPRVSLLTQLGEDLLEPVLANLPSLQDRIAVTLSCRALYSLRYTSSLWHSLDFSTPEDVSLLRWERGVCVLPKDAEAWPPLPYYIEGGIVQNAKWDDDLDEVKYAWEHVTAWRDYVVKAKKCKHDLRCGNCYGVTPKAPLKSMARCSKCKVMRYCSADCQKKDWKVRHKTYCAGQAHLLETKLCEFCRKAECICG